jgi:hypothetical protein
MKKGTGHKAQDARFSSFILAPCALCLAPGCGAAFALNLELSALSFRAAARVSNKFQFSFE